MAQAVSPRNQPPVDTRIQSSRPIRDAQLPLLQTSSNDLTQLSVVDASDAPATNLTPTTSFSSYFATGSTSRSQSLPRKPLEMPAPNNSSAHGAHTALIAAPKSSVREFPETRDSAPGKTSRTPPRSPSTSSMKLNTPVQLAQGQKRTASGEVKQSASPAQFQSPRTTLSSSGRHVRTMSTDSNANRIAEVSALLHSKLSYAAAKLESQWQMRSPESRSNGVDRNYSPEYSGRKRSGSSRSPQLSSGGIRNPGNGYSHHAISNGYGGMQYADMSTRNRSSSMSSAQHSNLSRTPINFDTDQIPRLAPPADIIANNGNVPRRRPNPNVSGNGHNDPAFRPTYSQFHRPSLSQQSSDSSNHTGFTIPDTPPFPQHTYPTNPTISSSLPKDRIPFQNSSMEQDAIETLLFLSSPENSGYRVNSQNQPNNSSNFASLSSAVMPPPSQLSQPSTDTTAGGRQNRRVSFADSDRTAHSRGETHYAKLARRAGRGQRVDDDIDRMLDAMDDSDSDMDEEWVAKLHEHVRNVSNRRRMTSSDDQQSDTPSSLPQNG